MLRQHLSTLTIQTPGRGLIEITDDVRAHVAQCAIQQGLLTLFIRHTSASLLIQENADPDVRGDLERFFARLVCDGDPLFQHRAEDADDMPAHVRSALTATQLSIPIADGSLREPGVKSCITTLCLPTHNSKATRTQSRRS